MSIAQYLVDEFRTGELSKPQMVTILQHVRDIVHESVLHPLVHRNTSDLSHQKFSSVFSGEEFYLSDHLIGGVKVFPGACYVEMAREAVRRSLAQPDGRMVFCDIRWMRKLSIEGSQEVHIAISAAQDGRMEFEVYTEALSEGKSGAGPTVHARGVVQISDQHPAEDAIDVVALRARAQRIIDSTQCYEGFASRGVAYGPAHRCIEKLSVGSDELGDYVIADLSLPACVRDTAHRFVLHPSLLDGALQASIGFEDPIIAQRDGGQGLLLPYGVERLEIFERMGDSAVVILRQRSRQAGSDQRKVDIQVCDPKGVPYLKIHGFQLVGVRRAEAATITARVEVAETDALQTYLFQRRWKIAALDAAIGDGAVAHAGIVVCVDSRYASVLPELSAARPDVEWHVLPRFPDSTLQEHGTADAVADIGCEVFIRVKSILTKKPKSGFMLQVICGCDAGEEVVPRAISGLLKSARKENPALIGQVISVSIEASAAEICKVIAENSCTQAAQDGEIRYRGAVREVAAQELLTPPDAATDFPWKDGGVYWISGGGGGLGRIFASEISSRCANPTIILTGRSVLSETQLTALCGAGSHGARIEYHSLNIADRAAVCNFADDLVRRHGALNGVIHSAGIIQDNFAIKKTVEEFRRTIEPKVAGTLNIELALGDVDVDFVIYFSSIAGVIGNIGQCDYAYGNAFVDGYAVLRNSVRHNGRRRGRCMAIAWPYWAEGGLRVDAATITTMRRQGFEPLTNADGVSALRQAMHCEVPSILVTRGQKNKILAAVGGEDRDTGFDTLPRDEGRGLEVDRHMRDLAEKTTDYVKTVFSSCLQIPLERIDDEVEFERFGIDSVLALSLVSELETVVGELPKTLMFEYQNIAALARYFLDHHREALERKLLPTAPSHAKAHAVRSRIAPSEPSAVSLPSIEGDSVPRVVRPPREVKHERIIRQKTDTESWDIAIIGIGGKYPQANNVTEFWENLRSGKDCITEIPADRWDHREHFDPEKGKPGKSYSKWGGFIDGVDLFDPKFFNIAPSEVKYIDPQERLFLQCAYQAMEDAGCTRHSIGKGDPNPDQAVGVFVGVMYQEYQLYAAQAQSFGGNHAVSGNPSSIANRVSYFCDFHGPSMAVDTMCSSSLTAIHLACESIMSGQCSVAIAGGVNVSIHPNKYLLLSQGRFVSSIGRCGSFGEGADGYVPGEGVGAVILKPLAAAVAGGDHIYGVVKGSAINHGGKVNGYRVPNPNAQSQVIARALKAAQISPRSVSYVEAHGTGTSLGDPIEIAGLTKSYLPFTDEKQFCSIGSVKSNIGHLESAAGIAAVTKVLLQMKHQQIAPSLHASTLNPHIDFSSTPFRVQSTLEDWNRPVIVEGRQRKEMPLIAGISAFGAGGSNAHLIIEEFRQPTSSLGGDVTLSGQQPALLILSARTPEALQQRAKDLLTHLQQHASQDRELIDIAYTLQLGREAMEHRLGFGAASLQEARDKLAAYLHAGCIAADRQLYTGSMSLDKEMLSLLLSDEGIRSAVEQLAARGRGLQLLKLWVRGMSVEWGRLYDACQRRPCKVALPTYPFQGRRYWIAPAGPIKKTASEDRERALPQHTEQGVTPSIRYANPPTQRELPAPPFVQERQNATVHSKSAICDIPDDKDGFVWSIISDELIRVLGLQEEDLNMDALLYDFGVESLSIATIGANIGQKLGISLEPTIFLEFPALRDVYRQISALHRGAQVNGCSVTEAQHLGPPRGGIPNPSA